MTRRSLRSNLDVLRYFGDIVRPIIGGKKSVKCIIDDGEVHLVRSVGLLLHLVHIQHPIGQYIVRVCRAFDNQYHTGTATLLFYIRNFSKIAVSLLEQGLDKSHVDRLMHTALEECIQHITKETIRIRIANPDIRILSPRAAKHNSVVPSEVNNSVCFNHSPRNETITKETIKPSTLNRTSVNKQNNKLDKFQDKIRTNESYFELGDQNIDDADFQKMDLLSENAAGVELSSRNMEKSVKTYTIRKEECSDRMNTAGVPTLDLEMNNLQVDDETVFMDDTDWFFENSSLSAPQNNCDATTVDHTLISSDESKLGVIQQSDNKITEDKFQNNLNFENLKQKWDIELIEDIKELKEAIEKDLTIVHERRERMNKRLAKYLNSSSKYDTDDEFDNCFEDLKVDSCISDKNAKESTSTEMDGGRLHKNKSSQHDIDRVGSSRHPERKNHNSVACDKTIKPDDEFVIKINLPMSCKPDSRSYNDKMLSHIPVIKINSSCNKENGGDIQSNKEFLLDQKKSFSDVQTKKSDTGQLKLRSRHLRDDRVENEGHNVVVLGNSESKNTPLSNCKQISQVIDKGNKPISSETKFSSEKKLSVNNLNATTEITWQSKMVSFHQNSESCDHLEKYQNKQTIKTDLSKIDSLITNLGISGKHKSGVEVRNISKSSRHVGQTNFDITAIDMDRKTFPPKDVTNDTKGGKSVSEDKGQSHNNTVETEKQKDKHSQNYNEEYRADEVKQLELFKLITGLCPYTDIGIVEIVHQIVSKQLGGTAHMCKLDSSMISCHKEVGVIPREPRLVDGLIISTLADNMELVQHWRQKPCRLLIVNGDIKPNYHHKGYKKIANTTTVKKVKSMSDHMTQCDQWLSDIKMVLKELSVNIVLARGLVCEEMKLFCQENQLIIMETVPYRTLEILSDTCQADMVTYLTLVSEMNVCYNVRLFTMSSGWMDKSDAERNDVVLKVPGISLQTVMFTELTNQTASLKEQDFWDCFHLVKSSLQTGYVLPGCARTEISCMEFCQKRAEEERHRSVENGPGNYSSLVYFKLAGAFKEYVDTYLTNIGIDEKIPHKNTSFSALKADKSVNLYQEKKIQCDKTGTGSENVGNQTIFSVTQGQDLYCKINNDLFDKHSMTAFQDFDHSMVNQSERALPGFDENSCGQSKQCSSFNDVLQNQSRVGEKIHPQDKQNIVVDVLHKQSADCDPFSDYFDDYVTQLQAWRTALDTVFVILGIDSFVQTGLTDENSDKSMHSAL